MPGLSFLSVSTVVPVFAAIDASVSPDYDGVGPRACRCEWCPCFFFVFEVTVVVGRLRVVVPALPEPRPDDERTDRDHREEGDRARPSA